MKAQRFEFDKATRRRLGYKLIDRINDYYSALPDRAVQLPLAQRSFAELTRSLPERGEDAATVLEEITEEMVHQGFHVPSGNYFGLMNPTPAYMAVLAEALVAALNPQLATLARSQLASKIENETLRWISERIGWPQAYGGTFTSGGNEANFSGLALAVAAKFPHAIEDGIISIGAQPVLYASSEAHHSLDKSAGLLGLGRKALRRIPVNGELQLDLQELEAAIRADAAAGRRPFCVVATAGSTNSGAIDDLAALAALCRRHALWLHVDGAYGAAAVFSDQHRALVRGMEMADSIIMDPHKWLAMPFAAGVILTSHPELLPRAFGISTPYMPRAAGAPPADNFKIGTQWSRRMNSLKLWLTLRVHGRRAYEELIERQLQLAADFAQWVSASRHYEMTANPRLPILNFRFRGSNSEAEAEATHAAIVDEVTREGKRWISVTTVNGRSVIRMMIISYLTDEDNIRALQQALNAAAEKLTQRRQLAAG